ncbi:MAG: hypothetical protein ACTSUE_09020 [Promethearchaeota archaeon]
MSYYKQNSDSVLNRPDPATLSQRRTKSIKEIVEIYDAPPNTVEGADMWGNPVAVSHRRMEKLYHDSAHHSKRHHNDQHIKNYQIQQLSWGDWSKHKSTRGLHWLKRRFTMFHDFVDTAWNLLLYSIIFLIVMLSIFFGAMDIVSKSPFFAFDGTFEIFKVTRNDPTEFAFFIILFFGGGFLSHFLWYVVDPLIKRYLYTETVKGGTNEERFISKPQQEWLQGIYNFLRLLFWFLVISGVTSHIAFFLAAGIGRLAAVYWCTHILLWHPDYLKPKHFVDHNDQILLHPENDHVIVRILPTASSPGLAVVMSLIHLRNAPMYSVSGTHLVMEVDKHSKKAYRAQTEDGREIWVVGVKQNTDKCYQFVPVRNYSSTHIREPNRTGTIYSEFISTNPDDFGEV